MSKENRENRQIYPIGDEAIHNESQAGDQGESLAALGKQGTPGKQLPGEAHYSVDDDWPQIRQAAYPASLFHERRAKNRAGRVQWREP